MKSDETYEVGGPRRGPEAEARETFQTARSTPQAQAVGLELAAVIDSETLGPKNKIIEPWLVRELEGPTLTSTLRRRRADTPSGWSLPGSSMMGIEINVRRNGSPPCILWECRNCCGFDMYRRA